MNGSQLCVNEGIKKIIIRNIVEILLMKVKYQMQKFQIKYAKNFFMLPGRGFEEEFIIMVACGNACLQINQFCLDHAVNTKNLIKNFFIDGVIDGNKGHLFPGFLS